ncbi:hypothetical protein [uncultured Rikenella sp.]|uniref:hypothetical protein n=1 Tax=uncultured Rikenella sp. TaxID=368003 RepID=UPI002624D4E6|nr:hypothetical protein [uncultured Rikenella sp.]
MCVDSNVLFRVLNEPAPGYRYADSGDPVTVGCRASLWMASIYNTDGRHLHFSTTWLYPNSAYGRGFGFQLRCLSE